MEVYDTLAIATPIMGLLAFACGQLLAILILRRRFARGEVFPPVQRRLQIGLYAGVAVFAGLWAYLFVLCARAVLRETIIRQKLRILLRYSSSLIGLSLVPFSDTTL